MKKIFTFLILMITLSGFAVAQNTIEGVVKGFDDEPLPGVNVTVKGTTNGTITDLNGQYVIANVPKGSTLTFSFMGMLTEEVLIDNQTTIDIMMIEDLQSLEEVVVVGYGSVKRANLTGAVADINAEKIEDIPVGNVTLALEGKMAGVKIGSSTGKPGSTPTIKIREQSTFGEMQEPPLYVIDGIILSDQDGPELFGSLDATEIESISILKDAAAAVYGSRSSGGVILVKTKRGKEGKVRISYSGSMGINKATRFPEMLSAYDHASMLNYIYNNDNISYPNPNYEIYTEDELEEFKKLDYNWVDGMWKPAVTNRHTLNISGGSEKVRYFVGGAYYYETGNLDKSGISKYSFRSTIEADVAKGLTARLGMNTSNKNATELYNYYEESPHVLRDTYRKLLTAPRWSPPVIDGKPVKNNVEIWHPYGVMQSGSKRESSGNSSNIVAELKYELPWIKGLSAGVQYNYSFSSDYGKLYAQDYKTYQFRGEGTHRHIITDEVVSESLVSQEERLQEGFSKSKNYQLNARINYSRSFGPHRVGATGIFEQAESSGNGFNSTLTGVEIPGFEQMWAFSKSSISNSPSYSEDGRQSYIGRLNYGYQDKYLLEGTVRADASANFHPDYRWGFFYSASAGWIVSQEAFFSNNVNFIKFLKVRGSTGLLGNDRIGKMQWKPSYNGNQTGAIFGSSLTNAVDPTNDGLFYESITWSKSNYYNGGIDMRMLEGKLDFTFDGFYKLSYDILAERRSSAPSTTGIESPPDQNYGKMYAKGIEISLGYNGKIINEIDYRINGNFTWTKHRKVIVDQNPAAVGRWDDQLLNDPSNQPGLICLGMIRNEEQLAMVRDMYTTIDNDTVELGMLYYADIRGENYSEGPDGKINEFDRTIIAEYTNPPFYYGFSLGASWKGLSVDMTFTGEFGHKVFIEKDEQDLPTETSNVFSFWNDYWTPENPDASMPRPYRYGKEGQVSTFWMRDGHTLKLNTLNISYRLPKNITQKVSIGDASIYFVARNLWTIISPFDFKDPSVSKAYDYPMIKTFNFGLKLTI